VQIVNQMNTTYKSC